MPNLLPHLFEPFQLKSVTFKNRIGISPMCQYSSVDGLSNDWHLVHLGSRAQGGAGLVIMEATAVSEVGRITLFDNGIWKDEHILPIQRIAHFVHSMGTCFGLQIAHAGRKASRKRPWEEDKALDIEKDGGWVPVAPSPIPFSPNYRTPHELTQKEIEIILQQFKDSAKRADQADVDLLEIHAAHGYLIQSFLSPLSNKRDDIYGGNFENRIRFLLEIISHVQMVWPSSKPLSVRLSTTEYTMGGWTIEDSIDLAKRLKNAGVDIIDCSSGGGVYDAKIPVGASYQVPLSEKIRKEAQIPTMAVGMIFEPLQADSIIRNGQADIILLARESLRNPNFPIQAYQKLNKKSKENTIIPPQYLRGYF